MIFIAVLNSFSFLVESQEINTTESDTIFLSSSIDSTIINDLQHTDTLALMKSLTPASFKPNPTKAVIYSAIFPGLGQIYNRKYWKLPLVYGGFMGFAYAISWNNKNLQDYSTAYKDIMNDDPKNPDSWHTSWQDLVPANKTPEEAINDAYFKDALKRNKDFYRRYRDLSIILTAAWYFICMADSYVDAQLFDFDISPDLSMHIEPMITPRTSYSPQLYGINCCIKF